MRTDRYKQTKTAKKRRSRTLRVLLILILLLLIAIPASIYYSYKTALDSLSVTFKDDNLKIEVGTPVSASECIADHEGDLTYSLGASEGFRPEDVMLRTEDAGTYTLSVKALKSIYGGLLTPEKDFSMTYTVTDDTPPLMLWSGDGVTVERGTEFDIKNVIGYGDNADPSPVVTYEGSVDMSENGSYPLHVTVTDASGNSTDWDMSVTVADELPSYSDSSEGIPFDDFVSTYKGDGRSFGIDVSVWQGDIDFEAVKNAGCEFVIIRIGYSGYPDTGVLTPDSKFDQNFKRARDAGLKVGLYMYSYDKSVDEARAAASQIAETLGGAPLDLPVAFDWEDFGQFQHYEMSFITLNRMYDAFAEELASAGYDCMLYGSKTYLEKIWTDTDVRPVWLAHYTDRTNYAEPYRIWQASASGRIDGIAGAVDLNIMYE